MRKLLLLVVIILVSCISSPQKHTTSVTDYVYNHKAVVKIILDQEFNIEERDNINEAVRIWNASANGNVLFNITDYKETKFELAGSCNITMYIHKTDTNDDFVKKNDKKKKTQTIGYATYTECKYSDVYLVTPRLKTKEKFLWTTLHEMFHGIGGDHSNNKYSIINSTYTKYNTCKHGTCYIPRVDLKQLCRIYNCDVKTTRYLK